MNFYYTYYPTSPSLIASWGVNTHWLITTGASTSIHPARHELLNLYLTVIHFPYFLQNRLWVLANLKPFDREAYIDALAQYPRLPEDFRLWILEWPVRAVIRASWPGLPPEIHCLVSENNIETFEGVN